MEQLLKQAKNIQRKIAQIRRELHVNAETGFAIPKTLAIVERELKKLGIQPIPCGKAGIVAVLGDEEKERVVLLRADMDGLPMYEATGEKYACKTGNMHACGHDMHTAMLLGAARLLKAREQELQGSVKLLFQPAEEILKGASDVIKAGALEDPTPQAALTLHVSTGTNLSAGNFVFSTREISAPAADYFKIEIKGKSAHGSTPDQGVDALLIAAYILLSLQTLPAREQSLDKPFVLTAGKMQGGTAGNAIADSAIIEGTVRCYDEDTRARLKKRIAEIALSQAKAFKGRAKTTFEGGCPTLKNDRALSEFICACAEELFGKKRVTKTDGRGGGSEDFAYISQKLPSALVVLGAGEKSKGYAYPLHHPKARFDERVLYKGSALMAYFAQEWLKKSP